MLVGVVLVALVAFNLPPVDPSMPFTDPDEQQQAVHLPPLSFIVPVKAPAGVVSAALADTDLLREQGLSRRDPLDASQGMLFAFENDVVPSFWMKDMSFPLDIVWIRSDKTVAGISFGVTPDTFPRTFTPPEPVRFVLEVLAGSAGSLELATGTQLMW